MMTRFEVLQKIQTHALQAACEEDDDELLAILEIITDEEWRVSGGEFYDEYDNKN